VEAAKKATGVTFALVYLLGMAATACADLALPKSVYRIQQLEDAQSEARKKNRPLCFLYTDVYSKCGLAVAAANDVIDALKSRTVIVYVSSSSEGRFLPPVVDTARKSPESGEFIPKTFIVDADLRETIAIVPYASERERKVRLTKAKTAISAWLKANSRPAPTVVHNADLTTARTWTSSTGATVEGRFIRIQQDIVTIERNDGTSVQIPISKLSPADQIFARQASALPLQQ
jgi:hypothetical protein